MAEKAIYVKEVSILTKLIVCQMSKLRHPVFFARFHPAFAKGFCKLATGTSILKVHNYCNYDLARIALWKLGEEDPASRQIIKSRLKC